jgi:hypothetical protein
MSLYPFSSYFNSLGPNIPFTLTKKTGYLSWYSDGLRAERPGLDSRQGQNFVLHNVHTGSGANPAPYRMSTGGDSRGGKATGA